MTGTLRGVSNKHCLLSFFSFCLTWSEMRGQVFLTRNKSDPLELHFNRSQTGVYRGIDYFSDF